MAGQELARKMSSRVFTLWFFSPPYGIIRVENDLYNFIWD